VFAAGAFDLSDKPEAMALMDLGFPTGVKFIHDKLKYYGEYTDPNINLKGWLYSLKAGTKERYFLIAQKGIPGLGDSDRWIYEYDDQGNYLKYFQGVFVAKP